MLSRKVAYWDGRMQDRLLHQYEHQSVTEGSIRHLTHEQISIAKDMNTLIIENNTIQTSRCCLTSSPP